MSRCDTCCQFVESSELVQVDLHFECEVCRGLKDKNTDSRTFFTLHELEGVDAGYVRVFGNYYTKSVE